MLTVLSIIGTRPEAIKMAPVIKRLQHYSAEIHSLVCTTGQHRDLVNQVLPLFDIVPDYELDVMTPNQQLTHLTANLLTHLTPVIEDSHPDWILAQGDTTTVFVAALIAFYYRIPFGHVEAGLRTGNKYMPFPEEMNRRMADTLGQLLFVPTSSAQQALLAEGIAASTILVTGNTVIDALLTVADLPYDWSQGPLQAIPQSKQLVLVTAHRRESFGAVLQEMCLAIGDLARQFDGQDVHFVYPVHPNPNVRQPVTTLLSGTPGISLIDPLDYLSMVHLMKRSILVLTDSGGIQEEAPSLGMPVLVMRQITERPESVEAGVVKLVGTQRATIVSETARLLQDESARQAMAKRTNPYGDGHAAERIVHALLERGKITVS